MSKTDWNKVISEYKSSGLAQSEFARSHGVSLSSLTYHLKRSRTAGSFVRIERDERVELELAGGIRLRVSERNLSSVLKALQA